MANDPNNTHEIFSSRVKVPATQFVGSRGRIFYHEDTGELRISDGQTPHGRPVYATPAIGSNFQLYKENGLPGVTSVAGGDKSIALGDGAFAQIPGSLVHASGTFAQLGDAQTGEYIARGISTNGNFTEIFLDGVSARLTVSQNITIAFTITFASRRADSNGEGAVFEIRGGINKGTTAMSTRIIGVLSKTIVSVDNPLWDVNVTADTSVGALRIFVKGEDFKTIRWVAHIKTVEIRT